MSGSEGNIHSFPGADLPPITGQMNTYSSATATVQPKGYFQTVYHHDKMSCADDDIPDTPAQAFRDSSGRVHLTVSHHPSNFIDMGPTLDNVHHVCQPTYPSANDTTYTDALYHEWISASYTLDGTNVVGLVHNEWYPYTTNSACTGGWANSIT